jgi:twinkle protein
MTEHSHKPCPFCDSSDAFGYNCGTGLFSCFSCGAKPSNKGGLCFDGKTITARNNNYEEIEEEGYMADPYVRDYRGIKSSTLEDHGAYFTKGPDGKETVHYQYPTGTKHRQLPKSLKVSGTMDSFFGQDEYNGGRQITITEGEEDRLSVIQIMGDWPCVSVPGASPSKSFWANARSYLSNFEKIVLSVDNDEAGNKLAEKIYRMFPGKTYRVNHGKYKDANDMLQAGEGHTYKSAWWNAQKIKPDNIRSSAEDFLKLYNETPDYEYFPTGIDELDDKIMGIHKGAFTVILAPTGIGKTEFMRYLEYQALSTSEYAIAICHLEETPLRSILGLTSYVLNDNVTRKDLIEGKGKEADVEAAFKVLTENEKLYQFQTKMDDTVDDLVEQIRFLVTAMGVEYVFLEPIQDLISGNTSEKESLLTDLTNKLKRLAPEINVGIVVIAHANDDGEAKYCRSIVQGAAFEIALERDVDAEDLHERNLTRVRVGRKNRVGGGSGPAGALTFDVDTYTMTPELGPQEPHVKLVGNGDPF